MAFDGIFTMGMAGELSRILTTGKIDKIYQPSPEDLILQVHTRNGNYRLIGSCGSQSARVCLTNEKYRNPVTPPNFCMLLRKYIQGARIMDVHQKDSERILEIDLEAQTEMGFDVSRRLIFEIMGKHSNICLIDLESGKILDCIKHISIDVNRYRQLLPGIVYKYPPAQEKIPFRQWAEDPSLVPMPDQVNSRYLLDHIGGISPAMARELAAAPYPVSEINQIIHRAQSDHPEAVVYVDEKSGPREFHLCPLGEYSGLEEKIFPDLSSAAEYYFSHRASSNMVKQKSVPLQRTVKAALDKAQLKKQRLEEDLLRARNSQKYRLYGELITANLHNIKQGSETAQVINYYTNEPVTIPLSPKLSPSRNAQHYFKKYSKAHTAIHEKQGQLEETDSDIQYLNSVLLNIQRADSEEQLDQIREELTETGYVRARKKAGIKRPKAKMAPLKYHLPSGETILVGRNNKENDWLTTKHASKNDLWFHTKDIPGSHVILPLEPGQTADDVPAETIYAAASAAAWHSKARESENVAVDFVPVRHVKKPAGAKPGMVIFTHNTTVYVNPKLPDTTDTKAD